MQMTCTQSGPECDGCYHRKPHNYLDPCKDERCGKKYRGNIISTKCLPILPTDLFEFNEKIS